LLVALDFSKSLLLLGLGMLHIVTEAVKTLALNLPIKFRKDQAMAPLNASYQYAGTTLQLS
tara:strand:- start:7739 stop:7921 length:183 start_codon:yes stop_codon:yes gene_type:complete